MHLPSTDPNRETSANGNNGAGVGKTSGAKERVWRGRKASGLPRGAENGLERVKSEKDGGNRTATNQYKQDKDTMGRGVTGRIRGIAKRVRESGRMVNQDTRAVEGRLKSTWFKSREAKSNERGLVLRRRVPVSVVVSGLVTGNYLNSREFRLLVAF